MVTDAKPKSVQVGDPITVTTTISGRGNFDRVNAPLLEDERGWHKYPPSSKFKQDDEVGISGTKTFEMVVSPNEKKQTLPVLAFSYFDPAKDQYLTLRSEPMAITVQGGSVAPNVAAQAASSPPASAAAHASAGLDCNQATGYSLSTDRTITHSEIVRADLHASHLLGGAINSAGCAACLRGLEDSADETRQSRGASYRCAAT